MFPTYFEFRLGTRVIGGVGLLPELGSEVKRLGFRRGFVLSDRGVSEAGIVGRVRASLRAAGVELAGVFDAVPPNSAVDLVDRLAAEVSRSGAEFVLAVGGGSSIDTAKAVGVVVSCGGGLLDHQGLNVITRPVHPVVAVPTTAGSGSEVTNFAVIRDGRSRVKLSFVSPYMVPVLSLLDPEVTLTLPPHLTASTGFDALTHAVEALVSTEAQPVTDALALHAVKLVGASLRRAVEEGHHDLEARTNMMVASCLAGIAFTNALVGCVHALSHACGGLYDAPHGLLNAVILPHGMEYNLAACPEKFALVGAALGVDGGDGDAFSRARKAIEGVRRLLSACGLPSRLREVGLKEEDIPLLAEMAATDGSIYTNPRQAETADLEGILRAAF